MIKRQKSLQTGNLLGSEKLFVVYHLFNSRDISGTHDLIPGTHKLSACTLQDTGAETSLHHGVAVLKDQMLY